MKHHIIDPAKSNITFCGLSYKYILCRPRYGFCNLHENHIGHHNSWAEIDENIISIADDNDLDSDCCESCLFYLDKTCKII